MIMKKTHLQYYVAIALIVCMTSPSWGQRARRGSSTLGTIGSIGQTSVSSGLQLGAYGQNFQANMNPASGNYIGQGTPLNLRAALNRPSSQRLGMLRQPVANVGAYNSYITPLNLSLARAGRKMYRDYTGLNSWAHVKTFGTGYYPGQQYMGIEHSKSLLSDYAFSAPIRANRQGGRISDKLSVMNLRNAPSQANIDLSNINEEPPNTVIEIMQNRNASMEKQNLRRAWHPFSIGKYNRSRDMFWASSTPMRPNPTSMLGIFISDAAHGRNRTAFVDMDRFLQMENNDLLDQNPEDQFNPFSLNVNLSQYFTEPSEDNPDPWRKTVLDNLIRNYYSLSLNNPDIADKCMAAQAILQWYSGEPEWKKEARTTLEKLNRDYSMSPYARLLNDLEDVEADLNDQPGE